MFVPCLYALSKLCLSTQETNNKNKTDNNFSGYRCTNLESDSNTFKMCLQKSENQFTYYNI